MTSPTLEATGATDSSLVHSPIEILYEHPHWFDRLFKELDDRPIPYRKVHALGHRYDPSAQGLLPSIVFNRVSPSAYHRDGGDVISYTLSYLANLELRGTRVINGVRAFEYEISKARQLSLLNSLGLPSPPSRVIHRPHDAVSASAGLRFPVVVKPNVGGSGKGVVKFDTPEALRSAVDGGRIDLGFDHVGLVQEFIPARGGNITRVEGLGGKFLYAIRVHLSGDTFDLCPADICQTPTGTALAGVCLDPGADTGLSVEGYLPPREVVEGVESILERSRIEVGGIEYIIDDRDGQLYYYDINALSNFVADAPKVIGFDPFVKLVDYLVEEAANV